jgi:hypothetical protein
MPTPSPDISEAEPLSELDTECLNEVRAVLRRHGALDRFGICLLHEHFDIADDEVMVESVDVDQRTLTTRPVHRDQLTGARSIETSWRLDSGDALTECRRSCVPGSNDALGVIHMH